MVLRNTKECKLLAENSVNDIIISERTWQGGLNWPMKGGAVGNSGNMWGVWNSLAQAFTSSTNKGFWVILRGREEKQSVQPKAHDRSNFQKERLRYHVKGRNSVSPSDTFISQEGKGPNLPSTCFGGFSAPGAPTRSTVSVQASSKASRGLIYWILLGTGCY